MTATSPATYYDHALNHASAAQASAVARARRSAMEDGTDYRVEFTSPRDGRSFWWNGCRYDAASLAVDLRSNRYDVTLLDPTGAVVDLESFRF